MSRLGIKQYGNKRKKTYSHLKLKAPGNKRKRKRTIDEIGADLICGDPNGYFKDSLYLSDNSDDVKWEEIDKCKGDLEKFYKQKIEYENEMRVQGIEILSVNITQQPKQELTEFEEQPQDQIPSTAPQINVDLDTYMLKAETQKQQPHIMKIKEEHLSKIDDNEAEINSINDIESIHGEESGAKIQDLEKELKEEFKDPPSNFINGENIDLDVEEENFLNDFKKLSEEDMFNQNNMIIDNQDMNQLGKFIIKID